VLATVVSTLTPAALREVRNEPGFQRQATSFGQFSRRAIRTGASSIPSTRPRFLIKGSGPPCVRQRGAETRGGRVFLGPVAHAHRPECQVTVQEPARPHRGSRNRDFKTATAGALVEPRATSPSGDRGKPRGFSQADALAVSSTNTRALSRRPAVRRPHFCTALRGRRTVTTPVA